MGRVKKIKAGATGSVARKGKGGARGATPWDASVNTLLGKGGSS